MAENPRDKTCKENIQENLLVIVVLIFTFIYFLFQVYAWFTGFQTQLAVAVLLVIKACLRWPPGMANLAVSERQSGREISAAICRAVIRESTVAAQRAFLLLKKTFFGAEPQEELWQRRQNSMMGCPAKRKGQGNPGSSGNIMVAIIARHAVPSKKAIASVLSLISISFLGPFAISVHEQYLCFLVSILCVESRKYFAHALAPSP